MSRFTLRSLFSVARTQRKIYISSFDHGSCFIWPDSCDSTGRLSTITMSYAQIRESSAHSSTRQGNQNDVDDDDDVVTVRSALSRKSQLPTELSEPLTNGNSTSTVDHNDPFYVFRSDLYRKLELVDETLAELLRVVHQTVSLYPPTHVPHVSAICALPVTTRNI